MNTMRILLCAALLTALSSSGRADSRMLFRDRFEPITALQQMEVEGASVGVRGYVSVDSQIRYSGRSSLRMGGVDRELRATHVFDRPLGEHSASVFVFLRDHDQSSAFLEIGFGDDDPVSVGISGNRKLVLRGARDAASPVVNFEPGWVELTLHRDGDELRVFAGKVVVAQWSEPRDWTRVALVRSGPRETIAWFDDLRIYTGVPDFRYRIAQDESRRSRLPQLGFRTGVARIVEPSSVDPGVNFEVDYTLRVRPGIRLGIEGAFQSGSILEDTNGSGDILLLGIIVEHRFEGTGFLARAEGGFGRLDEAAASEFGWFGARIGYAFPITPRLELVPTVGVRQLDVGSGQTQVPVAITLRWSNEIPGARPTLSK